MKSRLPRLVLLLTVSSALVACDGDGPPPTYTVSGTVSGLNGAGLVLANGGVNIPVSANGSFSLAAPLTEGTAYAVTVATQPSLPAQVCAVANGSGTANANVSNIAVTCVNVTYTISGTVSGLAGTGLVLTNNGVNLGLSSNGTFAFAAPVNAGATYNVAVQTQPSSPAQVCTVSNGSGTANANVSNVSVVCVTTPIMIAGSTPANNATNVLRIVVPAVTFSAAVDGASVPVNVTFRRGARSLAASTSTSGSTVTVTPQQPLSLLTTYTVAAGSGLRGSFGEPVVANASVAFTTRDGFWHPIDQVKFDAPSAQTPSVAILSDGSAVATWYEYSGPLGNQITNIWANTYSTATGWGTAVLLETNNDGHAINPKVVADNNGHAIVVWSQTEESGRDIWFNRYTVGAGWGGRVRVSVANVGSGNEQPDIAVNANGDAMIVWSNVNNQDNSIWARPLSSTGVLGSAARIEFTAGNAFSAKVVIDANGNATALWGGTDTANNTYDLWVNRYSNGSWGTAATLDQSVQSVSEYSLSQDNQGGAIAAWTQQLSNSSQAVYVSRYAASTGWGAIATLATTTDSSAYYPTVAADPDGNAMVMWGQRDGSVFAAYSSYALVGGSWGAAVRTGTSITTKLALDASGNAFAMWNDEVGNSSRVVKSARYSVTGGWQAPIVVTPGATAFAENPHFAIGPIGNVVAVWTEYDAANNWTHIAGSVFDDSVVQPR